MKPVDPLLLFLDVMQRVDPSPRVDYATEAARRLDELNERERRTVEVLTERLRRERSKRPLRVAWEPTQVPHAAGRSGVPLRLVVTRPSPHGPVLEVYGPAAFAPLYELASTLTSTEQGAHVVKWEVARARR